MGADDEVEYGWAIARHTSPLAAATGGRDEAHDVDPLRAIRAASHLWLDAPRGSVFVAYVARRSSARTMTPLPWTIVGGPADCTDALREFRRLLAERPTWLGRRHAALWLSRPDRVIAEMGIMHARRGYVGPAPDPDWGRRRDAELDTLRDILTGLLVEAIDSPASIGARARHERGWARARHGRGRGRRRHG